MSADNAPIAYSALDAFYASGGRLLDTARVYGTSEYVVGRWIAARGVAATVRVLSKGAHPSDAWVPRLSPGAILADARRSVESLGVPTVDAYLLHRDDPDRSVDEIATTLAALVSSRLARAIGVSNWSPDRVVQLAEALSRLDGPPLSMVSNYFGLAAPTGPIPWPGVRSVTTPLLTTADSLGFQILAWGSFSTGYFFRTDREEPPEFAGGANVQRREVLRRMAAEVGVDISSLLARWLATVHPRLIPVIGSLAPRHVEDLCRAVGDARLDGAVMELSAAVRGLEGSASPELLLPVATW